MKIYKNIKFTYSRIYAPICFLNNFFTLCKQIRFYQKLNKSGPLSEQKNPQLLHKTE